MSDIVKRCRENKCPDNMGCNTSPTCSCADLEDAADTIEQLQAELAALRELAIPEGFVLVPVEPTPGMIEAGRESLILGDFKKVKNNYERIYKAMLAAKENNHD